MAEGTIIIKKGREKPILNRHPWIFSGAISKAENANPGDIVTVLSHTGNFLARGYWNPKSQIQVRILTWEDEPVDEDWWRRMLKRSIDARALNKVRRADGDPIAYRMVNAENDYLPGLIVDWYAGWVVIQALTLGIEHRKTMLAELLRELLNPSGIYERSDVDVRRKEGLEPVSGLLWGEEPPAKITIIESCLKILVDVRKGHKTGFYLDQAENHGLYYDFLTEDSTGGCRLLNLFSYTGTFGLHALSVRDVHVVNIDSSFEVLELAEESIKLNDLHRNEKNETYELIQADVFEYLRDCVENGEQFDFVILDPPKFAYNKQQITKASRGYKDLNLNAFRVIKPGGYLMTFSCSGAISADLFQKIVFGALVDSGRQAQIIKRLGPGDDHPVALTFPEGAYLKGLLLRVW